MPAELLQAEAGERGFISALSLRWLSAWISLDLPEE